MLPTDSGGASAFSAVYVVLEANTGNNSEEVQT